MQGDTVSSLVVFSIQSIEMSTFVLRRTMHMCSYNEFGRKNVEAEKVRIMLQMRK